MPNQSSRPAADPAGQLRELEQQRCAAISAGDVDGLAALLSDDYVHVHMNGRVDDRAGHLEAVSSRPRQTTRGALTIRFWGDMAVLTGELTNRMTMPDQTVREMRAYCHQVVVRSDGAWRFVAVQLTPLAE